MARIKAPFGASRIAPGTASHIGSLTGRESGRETGPFIGRLRPRFKVRSEPRFMPSSRPCSKPSLKAAPPGSPWFAPSTGKWWSGIGAIPDIVVSGVCGLCCWRAWRCRSPATLGSDPEFATRQQTRSVWESSCRFCALGGMFVLRRFSDRRQIVDRQGGYLTRCVRSGLPRRQIRVPSAQGGSGNSLSERGGGHRQREVSYQTYDAGIPWIPGVAEGKAPAVTRAGIQVVSNPSRHGVALLSSAAADVAVFDAAGRAVMSRAATRGLSVLPLGKAGACFVKAGEATARVVVTD